MDSDFHFRKAQALSPKAAKIALRILDADPDIPAEWILAVRHTLVERSNGAPSFGTTDWMTIAGIERPAMRRFTEHFESREQRHARLWVTSLRQASGPARRPAAANTGYDEL